MSCAQIERERLTSKPFHDALVKIAHSAGDKIMEIYSGDNVGLRVKDDLSPLTLADILANKIIIDELQKLTPDIKYISEEDLSYQDKIEPDEMYWLIDPLDGTKEFLHRNGNFTVNIALIYKGEPIFGVIYAPTCELTYWGGKGIGAWKMNGAQTKEIKPSPSENVKRIATSCSHLNEETKDYVNRFPEAEVVEIGSSIKMCMLADGGADLYPRFSPTCEWDTAAGDAILRGVGGELKQLDGTPLKYGKPNILNPNFIGTSGNLKVKT